MYAPGAGEKTEGTVSRAVRKALTAEEAVAFIAGDDPRPLLVLRECKVCNGTDDALLKSGSDNEKTFLLSAWFHCVKLPIDVMEKDHPFHAMFTEKNPEHLFVASSDGSRHDPLESQTSRTELWKSMISILETEYTKKPKTSLKKLQTLLDKLDAQDARLREITSRRDEILEEDGPKSKKLPKLDKKIVNEEDTLAKLQGEVTVAYRLELRRQKMEAKEAVKKETSLKH
ncbi:MAG: hypothetical protein ACI8X5_001832 [Planctomycetota bacterium]